MSGERGPSISIVVPCYNEAANLRAGALNHVGQYAGRADDIAEVLVVDDGSVDDSRELVADAAAKYPKLRLMAEPHRGKAGAVIAGIIAARSEYVLFTDMDQATPIEELEKFRPHLRDGVDMIVGSRMGHRAGAPLVRKLMASGYIMVRRLILDLGHVTDTQCGFKALRADLARTICQKLRVFRPDAVQAIGPTVTAGFDAEMIYVARRLGGSIKEVPVNWHYVGTRRVHPIKESWRSLKGLWAINRAAASGLYAREVEVSPSGVASP